MIKPLTKKPNILWNNKGLTLVELMVAVGLIVIVISLGFTLLFFGMRSFDTGTAQAHTQQNVRLVGDYMRSELRNAVEITASEPDPAEPYFVIVGDVFKHNESVITNYVDINEITINIDESPETGKAILKFTIDAQFEEGSFIYEDQVLLNNLSYNEVGDLNGGHKLKGDGAIYYSKPD